MGGASFYNYQVTKIMPRWAVGVGVNLKIFDGLNREYKYSAAKQTVKQVEVLEMKAGKDIAVLIEKTLQPNEQLCQPDESRSTLRSHLRRSISKPRMRHSWKV